MSSRLSDQTDEIAMQWIRDLRTDLDDLKTGNQTVGPDSMIMNRVVSGNQLDINASVAIYALKSWRITYTATKMKNPYADFSYSYTVSNGTGAEIVSYWPDTTNTSQTSRSWILTISNDANAVTLGVLFALKASDTGTLSVVAL